MDYLRIWTEVDIEEIKESIIFVDDISGHCPGCKKIGIKLAADLSACPQCARDIRYITSKDARGGRADIVVRMRKKLPHLAFVDYDDFERLTGKKKAEGLFKTE